MEVSTRRLPARKRGMAERRTVGVTRAACVGCAASASEYLTNLSVHPESFASDMEARAECEVRGRGDVQVVSEDAEREDGHGERIAAQARVAAEEPRDDLVVVLWIPVSPTLFLRSLASSMFALVVLARRLQCGASLPWLAAILQLRVSNLVCASSHGRMSYFQNVGLNRIDAAETMPWISCACSSMHSLGSEKLTPETGLAEIDEGAHDAELVK
jgi:hypothetical protein